MPFQSAKQRAYLFSQKPAVAKQFAAETPIGMKLPTYAPSPLKKKRGFPALSSYLNPGTKGSM